MEGQGEKLNVTPGSRLPDNALERNRESAANSRRTREMAYEAAIKARESAAKSARTTKELALEVKQKARAAQIAAFEAKMEARLATRVAGKAKVTGSQTTRSHGMVTGEETNENDLVNMMVRQIRTTLTGGLEAEPKGIVNKEAVSSKKETLKEADGAKNTRPTRGVPGAAGETEWLSNGLFEGKADVLLRSANAREIDSIAEVLRSVPNLRVEFVSGSEDGDSTIAVLAEKPILLLDILKRIPVVDGVTKFGWRKIKLSLKKE